MVKEGDKVLITKPSIQDDLSAWIDDMDQYDGKICTVKSVHKSSSYLIYIRIEEDRMGWNFYEDRNCYKELTTNKIHELW